MPTRTLRRSRSVVIARTKPRRNLRWRCTRLTNAAPVSQSCRLSQEASFPFSGNRLRGCCAARRTTRAGREFVRTKTLKAFPETAYREIIRSLG